MYLLCISEFAFDLFFVHICRNCIIDIKQRHCILADHGTDKLAQCSVDIYLTGYREFPVRSDGCSHNMERIRTVSGMLASIFLRSQHIYDILCAPQSSLSNVSSYWASFERISGLLPAPSSFPYLSPTAGILSSPHAC